MADADRTKWDARYAAGGELDQPSPLLSLVADALPVRGRALDVAGGAGRNALWLARRGLDVTVVDISGVGLAIARDRAAAAGLALTTIEADLEVEPLPAGPWDLIASFHYLQRELFERFADAVAPGGVLVVAHATLRNLERHARPSRRYLLEEGELARLAARTGLEVERCDEGWRPESGRHDAILIARKQR